jgi:uncharacterized membrane protein (TIGR02234 family)
MAERRGGRSLAVAVLGGLACGGVALAGASRPWAQVEVATSGMPAQLVEVVGSSVAPGVGALALVVIAAALALLPTGGRLRRVVAALLLLASVGVVVGCALAGGELDDALRREVTATSSGDGAAGASYPLWRWVSLAGGLAGAALGAWALRRSAGWPVMGSRYEAPVTAPPGGPARDPDQEPEETDLWRAMDRGEDLT